MPSPAPIRGRACPVHGSPQCCCRPLAFTLAFGAGGEVPREGDSALTLGFSWAMDDHWHINYRAAQE